MELVITLLLGVVVGFFLGFYFSSKVGYTIEVSLMDIQNALEAVRDYKTDDDIITEEENEKDESTGLKHIIDDLDEFTSKVEGRNKNFFRVTMPFFVYSSNPESAYNKVRKALKKRVSFFCQAGAIDVNNVVVEKVTPEEVNESYNLGE